MFDLTKEIALDSKSYKKYRYFQATVYTLAVFLALYLGYLVIFPDKNFVFYPPTPDSNKNTSIHPTSSQEKVVENDKEKTINNLSFDTVSPGNYSQIQIDLTLNKNSSSAIDTKIEIRKSFQAFFYPEGNTLGFRDGTLLKNNNDYFIVSQGKLRKFGSNLVMENLGYKKEAALEASKDDLNYNEKGENIVSQSAYPDASVFKINDEYYILENQKLKKFVSTQAYLTQYSDSQAIEKNGDFLKTYPLDENIEGFNDGTLISYGTSAYIVSNGRVLPIDNPDTFLSKGYQWSDIIPVSGDELSLYQRDKLFNISSPHPNGTILATSDDSARYLVRDGEKHPLPSPVIASSWSKRSPVTVSSRSLTPLGDCHLKKGILRSNTFSCTVPIESFSELIGTDYEFKLSSENNTKIDIINISFQKTVNSKNFKSAVLGLIYKIKGNYAPQTPTPIQ